MNQPTKVKPLLRGHFHQAMFFVAVGACFPLLIRTHNTREFIAILVYTFGALTMFGISSLYHRVTWTPNQRALWKKLDHSGIFMMIAGSFTPFALLRLNDESGTTLLITIWSVTFVGVIQAVFFGNVPKYVSSLIYLVAGYLILPYIGELHASAGSTNIALIVAGGLSYSVGAVAYGLKRPVLNPKYFSYHEVFHLFVNLGATFHFLAVSSLIK